jgi:putative transposase
METTRAYKYRIYPDAKRQKEIDKQILLAKEFYNLILEKARKEYDKTKSSKISRKTFNRYMREIIGEDNKYLKIYSQTRQDIRDRLKKAYENFFKRVERRKKGEKIEVGFPRFKSRDRYYSIIYPQDNGSAFKIEKDRLRVSRIGTMKIELHRKIEGTIKTLTIKREAGNYYAIFSTEKEINVPKIEDINPVGIDVGLINLAALSDGTFIKKPNFRKNAQKGIAKWQRIVARREKGSKNREKAKLQLQKEYQCANNQQNDYLHKATNQLIHSGYTSFAVEDLNINNMVKNHHLANSIQSASWSKFKQLLSYKAESAGMKVIEVDAKGTSKQCSNCGNIQDIKLSERTYICNRCGMHKDRDTNAAINILEKAREGHSQRYARGDMASTIPDQQELQATSLKQEDTLQIATEAHTL